MSEHNLSLNDKSNQDLKSPIYHPLTPTEERTILSSYMDEHDSTTAIAMKLPKNFPLSDLNSTTTTATENEIIHSPYHSENLIEYKKELPTDIIDKYSGKTNKKQQHQQQSNHGKKNKKNKKVFFSIKFFYKNKICFFVLFSS